VSNLGLRNSGFSQDICVAKKWVNGNDENEWYFFMGAGAGMDAGMLPAACIALPSGLAMVQYKPDGYPECYPAANLSGLPWPTPLASV
jgi:hypothetical protein